ncbi:MAG: TonB-dependent receptor family protein, partial [Gammaproteobacteria bacterium]
VRPVHLLAVALPYLLPAYAVAASSAAAPSQAPMSASAAQSAPSVRLSPLVVTPTLGFAPGFDVPESVSVVGRTQIARGQPQVNLSESLQAVPGVVAQNRQDYAEGLQISIRGFGAIAPFGVQGVRLILDGLPATMPDGQGQSQIFDLPAIDRIEVLRGPFALGYGNSPGGVIRAFTLDGTPVPTLTIRNWVGSYGSTQNTLGFGDSVGTEANYRLTFNRFHTGGYRQHSAATRKQFYGKARYDFGATSLTAVVNLFHQFAEDPSGLTAAEIAQDPAQANPQALSYDARKDVHNAEGGLLVDTALTNNDSLHLTFYGGTRSVVQFLPFAGGLGLSSGGVVNLADYFGGTHAHYSHDGNIGDLPYTVTAGFDYDRQNEYRKGFVNNEGVSGALRRNEFDVVDDFDQYVQSRFSVTQGWSLNAGLRHNLVRFNSQDFFVTDTNPDDSGSARYSHVDPVIGTLYKLDSQVHLYATWGRGFQTPTFYQLAYKPDGAPGLNFALKPAVSDNYEAGVKAFAGPVRIDASVFHIRTRDDIVVANSQDGRTSYENAAATRRDGVELRLTGSFVHHLSTVVALSYINARYDGGANGGNSMSGVPSRTAYVGLTWEAPPSGFYTTAEAQYRDRVYVDSGNTATASPYAVVNWRAGFRQQAGRWRFEEFLRIDNLLDRRYVGAVVVGDSNGRYYQPAPGRNYTVGLALHRRF